MNASFLDECALGFGYKLTHMGKSFGAIIFATFFAMAWMGLIGLKLLMSWALFSSE
jgi:hypothetical protein